MTDDEAADGFGRNFEAPAGDAFHKSMPMLRLVAGMEPTGFPGTEACKMELAVLF